MLLCRRRCFSLSWKGFFVLLTLSVLVIYTVFQFIPLQVPDLGVLRRIQKEEAWNRRWWHAELNPTNDNHFILQKTRLRSLLQNLEEKITRPFARRKVIVRGQNFVIHRDLPVYQNAFQKLGFIVQEPHV